MMVDDDDFTPHLGRIRSRGAGKGRKFLNRVIAAANLARGGTGSATGRGFTCSKIGRGAGVGRVLAARDRFAAFRQRRVVIKSRIVRLTGRAVAGARAHLRYIQRDGVTREGMPGDLYGPDTDAADGKAFLERGAGDRHQFRFIVSAEDGDAYEDLKPLTRRWMAQMEEDLGTRLDWVAVDHFNTGHPHTHVMLRGTDAAGKDLVIARDYLTRGMRERAAELVQLDLGPRTDREVETRLRREVGQERWTSIDQQFLERAGAGREISLQSRDPFRDSLERGRLQKLARLGLAREDAPGRWQLSAEFEPTLRALGARGDILLSMQRALDERRLDRAAGDRVIFAPDASDARPLVGRVVARGLADELADRHYLLVDGVDGRSHYVAVGKGESLEPLPQDAIVRITSRPAAIRDVDRTIAAIAQTNADRYDIEAHLRADPTATEAFARAHVRRLEAIRRSVGGPERDADGSWRIGADHLDRALEHERRAAADRPVAVELLSPLPLDQLPTHVGATWLDRQVTGEEAEPLRESGFGQAVRGALAARRQWLLTQGLDLQGNPARVLQLLERREIALAAGELSARLNARFVEAKRGARVEGILVQKVDLASGRFAVLQKAKEFTLVPWRPELERRLGQSITGTVKAGGIDWAIGRTRGPGIG